MSKLDTRLMRQLADEMKDDINTYLKMELDLIDDDEYDYTSSESENGSQSGEDSREEDDYQSDNSYNDSSFSGNEEDKKSIHNLNLGKENESKIT